MADTHPQITYLNGFPHIVKDGRFVPYMGSLPLRQVEPDVEVYKKPAPKRVKKLIHKPKDNA